MATFTHTSSHHKIHKKSDGHFQELGVSAAPLPKTDGRWGQPGPPECAECSRNLHLMVQAANAGFSVFYHIFSKTILPWWGKLRLTATEDER